MTPADKATLDSIESLIVANRVSVAKALATAYALGELEGQLKMAKIGEGMDAFAPALDFMSGKVKPNGA